MLTVVARNHQLASRANWFTECLPSNGRKPLPRRLLRLTNDWEADESTIEHCIRGFTGESFLDTPMSSFGISRA